MSEINVKNTEERNNTVRTLKAGAWYTICNMILKGASMLLSPVYTRLMTLAEYGFNSTIGTWFSMMGTIVTADLSASVHRAKYEFQDHLDDFISSITFLGSLITLGFYTIVICFSDFFCKLFGCRIEYFHLQFAILLISPAMSMLQSKYRLENKYKVSVALSLSTWVLAAAANILMLVSAPMRRAMLGPIVDDRVLSMHIGGAIPSFLVNIVVYTLIMRRGRVLYKREYWKYALAFCLPLIPHLLAGQILSHSDRIMITRLCGEEYTALYTITYTCSAVVSMVFNSLNQAWVPWFNDKYYNRKDATIKKVTTIYVLIFFTITLGAVLIGPELLLIIGGHKYMPAVVIMPVVMVSCFFQFNNAFFVNVEMFEKKTLFTAIGTLIAAGLNVSLNYVFLPKYGYTIGAYTTLLGFLFLHIYHHTINRLLIKKRLGGLYPVKLIEFLLIILLIAIYPMILLYQVAWWLRWILIVLLVTVFAVLLYKNKDHIQEFLKKSRS